MHTLRLGRSPRLAVWLLSGAAIAAAAPRPVVGQPATNPSLATWRDVGTLHALLSPSVEATWVVRENRLALLILWRGQPGRFRRQPSGFVDNGVEQVLVRGVIKLSQKYDAREGVVHIQGIRTELRGDNVVFVDEVDRTGGARVIGQLRIDPTMPGSPAQIGPMLARSPPIMAFLRCDVLRPGLEGEAWLRTLCLETIGVTK